MTENFATAERDRLHQICSDAGSKSAMLTFRDYITQLDETTDHDSLIADSYIRSTTLTLVTKIRQLHNINMRSTSKDQQRLSAELMGLAYLMCIVIGVQTSDRLLVQRGRGSI